MLPNATYILQTGFYKHPLKKCIKFVTKVYNIFNLELLFTPFTVTRFAMHRNHALHDFAPQLSGFL